jgi:hypothetical protein
LHEAGHAIVESGGLGGGFDVEHEADAAAAELAELFEVEGRVAAGIGAELGEFAPREIFGALGAFEEAFEGGVVVEEGFAVAARADVDFDHPVAGADGGLKRADGVFGVGVVDDAAAVGDEAEAGLGKEGGAEQEAEVAAVHDGQLAIKEVTGY